MSKYFSDDSDLLKTYSATEEGSIDTTRITPSTDNLTQPLSEEKKQLLAVSQKPKEPSTTDEYIHHVEQQTEQVSQMIRTYSEETKQEMVDQFDKFSPVEMFAKMNQLFFIMSDLSNKVSNLEKKIDVVVNITAVEAKSNGIDIPQQNNEEQEIKDPATLYAMQQMAEKGISEIPPQSIPEQPKKKEPQMNINDVKRTLSNIKSGKALPDEGFTDKSVNLEEMFPKLDDDAYQAAYGAIDSAAKKTPKTKKEVPEIGSMRNIAGF